MPRAFVHPKRKQSDLPPRLPGPCAKKTADRTPAIDSSFWTANTAVCSSPESISASRALSLHCAHLLDYCPLPNHYLDQEERIDCRRRTFIALSFRRMFTWAVDDFPQLGAGTQAPLLGCWAKTPQVSAAPLSVVAEGSSVRGPGGVQNSWKPAGSKRHEKGGFGLAKIQVVRVRVWLPPEQLAGLSPEIAWISGRAEQMGLARHGTSPEHRGIADGPGHCRWDQDCMADE
eukprot:s790_g7.t1